MDIDDEIKKFALLVGIEESRLRDFIVAAKAATRRVDCARPELPSGFTLPSESYTTSPEARRGGGGIVAFLERVWLPLIQAVPGVVDLRTLRAVDPSAAMAIANLKRHGKAMPTYLDFPTKRELNDRALAQIQQGEPIPFGEAERLERARRRRPSLPKPR